MLAVLAALLVMTGLATGAQARGGAPSPSPSPAVSTPPGPAGGAPGNDQSGAPDNSTCGTDRGLATYHGSNAERELHRAIPDPLKVGNYPCSFPPSVRAIRLELGEIQLVAGGRLARSIPYAGDAFTLPRVTAAVGDASWIAQTAPGTFLLSAALLQEKGTTLRVAAPAVRHVQLLEQAGVSISGSQARADFVGVEVSSYLPTTKAPDPKPTEGRPFLLYENGSTLNLSHSTLHYLGSDETSSYGVSWRVGGTNGLVDHCVFEHNFFGVYTFQAQHITFQHSTFRDNTFYGLDPHTNSSHLTIVDNDVYGNADHGIVFSRYVTDSVVRGNRVHDNKVNGIMMDYLSNKNTITGNTVWHNAQGIVFADSGGGTVTGNVLRDNGVGIRMSRGGARGNTASHNTITGGTVGVQVYAGASDETFAANTVTGASKVGFVLDAARTTLTGNTVTGPPVGVQIRSVADVTGGMLDVAKTGIVVTDEGIAAVTGVRVADRAQPLALQGAGAVTLTDTAYGLPGSTRSLSALDILGVALVLFALLCELVNVGRSRILKRRAAFALVAFDGGPARSPRLHRLVIKARPALEPLPAAEPAAPRTGLVRAFRPDIEGMRAIAVLSVVLAHAGLGVRGGYIGVDVFFVISGFLITRQLCTEHERVGRISFARFYARRARRILPAATVVTVVTVLASYVWLSPLRVVSVTRDAVAAALFSANWRFAQQGTDYFHATAPPSPFQHYWSLSVEEQFYFVWPLLLVGLLLLLGRWLGRTRVLAASLVAIIGVSLALSVYETTAHFSYGYFATYTRAWELALGALVAVTAARWARLPGAAATPLAWLGLGAIVVSAFLFGDATAYPGYAAALPVGGAAALIAAGCGSRRRRSPESLLGLRPMQTTGRLSYSWYLWHWPVLVIAPVALGHALPWWQRLLAMLAALAVSAVSQVLIEDPFRRQRDLVRFPRRALALGAGLVAASLVVAVLTGTRAAPTPYAGPVTTPTVDAALQLANRPLGETVDQALATELERSADATTLPADLAPPLDHLTGSFSNTKGCEVTFTVPTPLLPCNQFGDTSASTQVVLLGDSHAGMWLAGIAAVASSEHWHLTVFTKSGCPFGDYPDYVNPTLKRVYTECNAWRSAVLAKVRDLRPAMVIVGSEAKPIVTTEPGGLATSISALRASGARVVFLADTPAPRSTVGDVPQCLAAHATDMERCDAPRAPATSAPGRAQEVQGAHAAGAVVVDPAPWFCTATSCPAVIGHTLVFFDDAHITAAIALQRVPQLQAALAPVVSSPAKGST